MKAVVLSEWKHLERKDIPKPQPGSGQALLKISYAGICGSDISVYKGVHPTARAPVVPGHEMVGTIEAFGAGSDGRFAVGERVTVEPLVSCGHCSACREGYFHVCDTLGLLGIHANGGFSEYICVDTCKLVKLPQSLSDQMAALAEPFAVAYHVNHRAGVRSQDKVLVIGAGPIGIPVALASKNFGASRVIVSEPNPKRVALAKKLGLEAYDPAATDLNALCSEVTGGNRFDVVIDSSGSKSGMLAMPDLCKTRGTMVPLSLSGEPSEFFIGKVGFRELHVVGTRVYSFDHFCRGVLMLDEISKSCSIEDLVTDVLPLNDLQNGYDMMMAGENAGKILAKIT